jgi:hypothetical protein
LRFRVYKLCSWCSTRGQGGGATRGKGGQGFTLGGFMFYVSRYRIHGVGFGLQGLGFLVFIVQVLGLGFRV